MLLKKNLKKGSNREEANQYLTNDRIDSIAKIVNDDARWQWSQGGGGGDSQDLRQRENDNNVQVDYNNVNSICTCKYVYNHFKGGDTPKPPAKW